MPDHHVIDPNPPLGASITKDGATFVVYSAHAEGLDVCLFDKTGQETDRVALSRDSQDIWHGCIPELSAGQHYGFRASGPFSPNVGHRFNHQKLLLDPYATKIAGNVEANIALHDESQLDSAPFVPKSVIQDSHSIFDWGDDTPPRTAWRDTIIYEAHVKGLTQLHPQLFSSARSRYQVLGDEQMVAHLTSLGITAIELLPVHSFIDDAFLRKRGLSNYWGYNTLNYFCPDQRYGSADDLRLAVRTLHSAGIEVILDVVYNHTAEADNAGPCLSFRGLDNATYYGLEQDNPSEYINDTGCGNTLNTAHPIVTQLIIDSLRHWVQEFHIDGFRFDLATVLGRTPNGFDPDAPLLRAILDDPVLSQTKLIAEPWDIGPGGYQLGNFPIGFAEWNDRFRDDVRAFWRGDAGTLSDVATRFMGSAEIFDDGHRAPHASVNFITAHDGFTLMDLVSYSEKHNDQNGENNDDGHGENLSGNAGVEGPSDDLTIIKARDQRRRNLFATLILSQGTPMVLAGDELGNSQYGNNNAYCQDNNISWLSWSNHDEAFLSFARHIISIRKKHPILRSPKFLHGEARALDGMANVEWLAFAGETLAWEDPKFARVGIMFRGDHAENLLIAINNSSEDAEFSLPHSETSSNWACILDTAQAVGVKNHIGHTANPVHIKAHSMCVFETG